MYCFCNNSLEVLSFYSYLAAYESYDRFKTVIYKKKKKKKKKETIYLLYFKYNFMMCYKYINDIYVIVIKKNIVCL